MTHDIHLRYTIWFFGLSCTEPGMGLMTLGGPFQLQRFYSSIHKDFLKDSCQASYYGSWSHWVAQVRKKILSQLNVFSWWRDQNKRQIFFLESSAETSPPGSVLHKEPGRGNDQWGEVCWGNYSRGKAKDKLEESHSTEQLLIKQQMKSSAAHWRVNHRHKIHPMSQNKMKGSELITEFREQLLGL